MVVGGVAANSRVRALAERRCASAGIELRVPPMTLCTDNGAMIAAIGDLLVRSGAGPAPLDVTIDPSAPWSTPPSPRGRRAPSCQGDGLTWTVASAPPEASFTTWMRVPVSGTFTPSWGSSAFQ